MESRQGDIELRRGDMELRRGVGAVELRRGN
jgi:hypothetical protein